MQTEAPQADLSDIKVCRNPIFVIGAPRSGTTALGYALGQHSLLHTLPESHVFVSLFASDPTDSVFEAVFPETFLYTEGVDKEEFRRYLALAMNGILTSRSEGKRWVDHTPFYAVIAPMLAGWFPQAKFVHILRNPRRVVDSMVHMRNAFSEEVKAFIEQEKYQLPTWVGDFRAACREWSREVVAATQFAQSNPDRCLTVVNEDLTADPERGFRQILEFLDLPYEHGPAGYFGSRRIASSFSGWGSAPRAQERPDPWAEWTAEQKGIFFKEVGRTLFTLGLATQDELLAMKAEAEAVPSRPEVSAPQVREAAGAGETPDSDDRINELLEKIPLIELPGDYLTEMPRFLARMADQIGPVFRREAPIEFRRQGARWIVYMVGPEANYFVLQSHRNHFSHDRGWTPLLTRGFENKQGFEKGLLNMDDPEHARHRKMMNPAFDMQHMSAYIPVIEQVVAERTGDWVERGQVDLSEEARKITFDVVAEALVGLQRGEQVDLLRELFYQVVRGPGGSGEQAIAKFMVAREELNAMLLHVIAERRATPADDILGMLVGAQDEQGEGFTDRQLLGHLQILLAAGHETTTSVAACLLYQLALTPDYLDRVREEIDHVLKETGGGFSVKSLRSMKVLQNAFNEAARVGTIGNGPRGVVKDFEFGGYTIPAGSFVLLSGASHQLPNIFENPDQFDPDRFAPPREEHRTHPYAFFPFGGGNRPCIGMNLAQVEVKILAARVLQKYDFELVEGQTIAQVYFTEVASIYPDGIKVRVKPRS